MKINVINVIKMLYFNCNNQNTARCKANNNIKLLLAVQRAVF